MGAVVMMEAVGGYPTRFGHVHGFGLNAQNEVLIVVQIPKPYSRHGEPESEYEFLQTHPVNLRVLNPPLKLAQLQ